MPPHISDIPQQPVAPDVPLAPPSGDKENDATSVAIEHKLDASKKQLTPDVLNQIYGDLNNLRGSDDHVKFQDELASVNAKLHSDGYLPNLYIVSNASELSSDPTKMIGPNSENGFHLSNTEAPPSLPLAAPGEQVDQTSPAPAPLAPGNASQGDYQSSNPVSPAGDNGYNSEGNTPIGNSDVQSNPVVSGNLDNRELVSQIQEALRLLNAQRAAKGLPPIPDNSDTESAILTIIKFESGNNPNAQNNSDSNAAKGDPSKGLMQTIGSTFSSYHVQGTSNNIFDPVANIAAGVNYAVNRYGSIDSVPGIKAVHSGGSYVGY